MEQLTLTAARCYRRDGALVVIERVLRRATRRRMRNTDRRHVVLVIQRVILSATIVGVTAFASRLTLLLWLISLVCWQQA
jgi:hypothetical protein